MIGIRGFTLIELLVAITIASILLAIAIPSFSSIMLGVKLSSYADSLVAGATLARSEAIKRNAVVSMCVSANGASCGSGGWEQGWLVMCNTSDNVVCDSAGAGTLVIQHQAATSAGWKITESSALTSIAFQPTGTGATSATLVACRAAPTVGDRERVVRISASGRPSVTRTSNGACS